MVNRLMILITVVFCFSLASIASAAELIRVALVEKQATVELSCTDDFVVSEGQDRQVLPKGKYFAHLQAGRLQLDDEHSFTGPLTITAQAGKALPQVNRRSYQGSLQLLVEDNALLVINQLPLESYLASVLPAKTMVVWPDEVIKAQAVAARTYALYKKQHSTAAYDLSATDSELPYEGTGSRIEKSGVTKLIKATAGQYLVDASGLPIEAVTTSSSGGHTESAAQLWGHDISYLQGVVDYDSDSPEYSWEYRATPAILEGLLAQRGYVVGKLNSILLSPLNEKSVDRTATGRVKYVILTGEAGTAKVTGSELAQLLGLNSTLFDVETGTPVPETLKVPIENYYGMEIGSKDIDIKVNEDNKPVWRNLVRSYHLLSGGKEEKIIFKGKGKGEGLGLSAWGARGLANSDAKATYRTILAHYYTGARLVGR